MCSNRQSGVGRVMAGAAGAKRALDAGESRESVLTAFRTPGVAKGATVAPNLGKRRGNAGPSLCANSCARVPFGTGNYGAVKSNVKMASR